jgi:hypothetical protein
MSHADTARTLVSLLHRCRRLLDELADGNLTDGRLARCEAMAARVAETIGHRPTDVDPAPELLALLDHVDNLAAREGEPTEATPPGGDGCDVRMVHHFGPDGTRLGFDADGHPPNCPAHINLGPRRAQAVHAPTCEDGKSRESATRTTEDKGRRARVDAATRAQIDRQKATAGRAGWETPEAYARRLDRERDEAGKEYRRRTQDADAAWRQIGGRP